MQWRKLRINQTLVNFCQHSDQDVAQVKKKHLIQSALLWFRDRTPEQAVDRFCELRAVDTLVLASNGNPTWTDKIKVTTSDYCVNYVSGVDIIIWRDPNPTPAPNTQFPEWDFSVAADSDQFPVITEHDLPRSGESRRPSLNTITRTLEKGTDRRHSTVDANLRALRPSTDSTKPSSSRRHSLDNGDMMRPNPPPCPRPAEKNNTPLSRERALDKKKNIKTRTQNENNDDPENPTGKYQNYSGFQNSQNTDFIQGDIFCDSF